MDYVEISEQKTRLNKVVHMAGPRYDTRVNIVLPISFTFDVLGRTEEFNKKLLRLGTHIWAESRFIGRKPANDTAPDEYHELTNTLKLIAQHLKKIRHSPVGNGVKWKLLSARCASAIELISNIVQKLNDLEEKNKEATSSHDPDRDLRAEISELYRLGAKLRELKSFVDGPAITALSKNSVLINGQAGSGKTHLLCDVATIRINANLPTYIFLGDEFTGGDPLIRIAQLIHSSSNAATIFKKINDYAFRHNVKALIMIDAINEATGKVAWGKLAQLKKYKNIAVVMSIRSGFEQSELNNTYGNQLIKIEHEGFGELDWQAVTNFFQLFSIPLPRVPIIAPEFRNPLFLKLFCETYQRSSDFRGHIGTTRLFEAYNKKQGNAVLADLSLPVDKTRIWKKVIKPIAQWMADNSEDRILESRILNIIEQEFAGRSKEVLKLLQRHWLITKVPHYTNSGKIRGHEYRFPYQKFSDHLIARCLLTTHLRDTSKPEQFFTPDTPLGKVVGSSWSYGLIEALSIQVPERLDGKDLAWVVPEELRSLHSMQKGFLQSIVWRDLSKQNGKHKHFNTQSALDYVNKFIIGDYSLFPEFLNALISIAGLPEHPLNANILDRYLRQFTMADRDVFWQEFLVNNYEDHTMIKRLINWAWHKESKQYLSDDSLELVATPIVWFLASSNRVIRDRSTKALVELLKCREEVLINILERFNDVNDPYVKQRLYAVAYGCALRSKSDKSLKKLALAVYNKVFSNGITPVDILLRDYARNVVELYYGRKPEAPFLPEKFRPPYGSIWPEKVPSLRSLQKRYREDDDERKDYYTIWSSVIYGEGAGGIGDFGNYVVNSNLSHFTSYLNGTPRPRTESQLLKEFESKLIEEECELWENVQNTRILRNIFHSFLKLEEDVIDKDDTTAEEAARQALEEFTSKVLSKKRYQPYRKVVHKSLAGKRLQGFKRYDAGRGQRWIVNRVMQLGWRPEKHGHYDNMITQYGPISRDRNRNERIGKKYQWIALHELLACVADNFSLGDDYDSKEPQQYEGPWQLSIRDIDPSHTIERTSDRKPHQECWWTPVNYSKWNQIPRINDWLKSPDDLPDFKKLIQVTDPKDVTWLNLKSYYTWDEPLEDIEESRRYDIRHKQVWVHVNGYIIDKANRLTFYKWAKQQDFWNRWMPESSEYHGLYLGEFPNSEAFRSMYDTYYDRQDWTEPQTDREKHSPVRLMVANDEYLQERNTSDCSVEEGFTIQTPCKYLYQGMKLSNGLNNGEYVTYGSHTIAFVDPSVQEQGPGVLLANKQLLMKFLDQNNLTIVWTILGEKMLIGGHRDNFNGRLRINGAYTLPSTKPYGSYNVIIE